MVKELTAVRTPKALEFGFDTPEGNAFWVHMEKWRRHEEHLQRLKAEKRKKPTPGTRGFASANKAYEAHQLELVKYRAILKRDYTKAVGALVAAFNAPDIRLEYETEIYALAHELGLSRREFEKRATPPSRNLQKSFALIPAH